MKGTIQRDAFKDITVYSYNCSLYVITLGVFVKTIFYNLRPENQLKFPQVNGLVKCTTFNWV